MAVGTIQGPAGTPAGTINSVVYDNDGLNPSNILDGAKKFTTMVGWKVDQPMADLLNATHRWRIQVFADELGGKFDERIGVLEVPAVASQTTYPVVAVVCDALVNNPPATVPGLYRLATTVTLVNGAAPTQSAGFVENGMIQTF